VYKNNHVFKALQATIAFRLQLDFTLIFHTIIPERTTCLFLSLQSPCNRFSYQCGTDTSQRNQCLRMRRLFLYIKPEIFKQIPC